MNAEKKVRALVRSVPNTESLLWDEKFNGIRYGIIHTIIWWNSVSEYNESSSV